MKLEIAIILATYNGEKFIKQQIESILNQDYKDWFLYISDDCSQDGTLEILQSFCSMYPQKMQIINSSIRFGNAKDNFFYLIEQVTGDMIFFSDQDDVWMPNKISVFLEFYNGISSIEKQRPLLLYSDLYVVNLNMELLSNSVYKYQRLNPKKNQIGNILVQNCIFGCSMAINKKLKEIFSIKCLNDTDREKIIMHDWYLALIASEFGTIKYINKPLVYYRQHRLNTVGAINANNINYIKYRLLNFKVILYDIERTKQQANVFKKNYLNLLSRKTNEMVMYYSKIRDFSFFFRLFFFFKNHMLKHGFTRIVMQFLFS